MTLWTLRRGSFMRFFSIAMRVAWTRLRSSSPETKIRAGQLAHGGAAHQPHVALDLRAQQAERALDGRAAAGRQRKEIVAADADRLGAERKRLEDVRSALNAAVHHHVEPIADGIDDFGELVERRTRAVELPSAMVRQH